MAELGTVSNNGTTNSAGTEPQPQPQTAATSLPEVPPQKSIQERASEFVPGMVAASHAGGMAHILQSLADFRKRVRQGHRAMARSAGMEDLIDKDEDEEEMNINVQGDTVYNVPTTNQLPAAASTNAAQSAAPAASTTSSLVKTAAPWVLAAVTGGGLLGMIGKGMMTPAPVNQSTIQKSTNGFLFDLEQAPRKRSK